MSSWPILLAALALVSCATYRDELNLSQRHFESNEFERSLVLLRDLETDIGALSSAERTRYAYFRGMADYRMSYRADARHWLALAQALDEQAPGALSEPWKSRMTDALRDLNQEVYDLCDRGQPASSALAGATDSGPVPSRQ